MNKWSFFWKLIKGLLLLNFCSVSLIEAYNQYGLFVMELWLFILGLVLGKQLDDVLDRILDGYIAVEFAVKKYTSQSK